MLWVALEKLLWSFITSPPSQKDTAGSVCSISRQTQVDLRRLACMPCGVQVGTLSAKLDHVKTDLIAMSNKYTESQKRYNESQKMYTESQITSGAMRTNFTARLGQLTTNLATLSKKYSASQKVRKACVETQLGGTRTP